MVCLTFLDLRDYVYHENHKKFFWIKGPKIQFFVHYEAKNFVEFLSTKAQKNDKFGFCRQIKKPDKILIPTQILLVSQLHRRMISENADFHIIKIAGF